MPDVRAKPIDLGVEPVGSTPGLYMSLVIAEMAKSSKVFKEAGITPEQVRNRGC